MGERELAPVAAMKAVADACQKAMETTVERADEAMRVQTPGGVFSVRWDAQGSATALGQLAFFAEYLEATGLFQGWLKSCPLSYTSPNAPELARSTQWMREQLKNSIAQATATPWILDCDTTIKVLYGKQDGAVVSYNPHKLGRPSHAIHTYWIGNLRLVLDAQLEPGNRHSPVHARPGLMALLEGLPQAQRPKLVRGDCAFGSEGEMSALEAIEQPYLFKRRQSAGVKRLVKRQWSRRDGCAVGQGWEACEDTLLLTGWTRRRRVIVMRRVRKTDLVIETQRAGRGKGKDQAQSELHFIDENEPAKSWEYAVLVCNTHYELQNIGQLYRDRADCENGFDEIKNQWGWGGYSTHDIQRCALSARAVALVYNRRNWHVGPQHHKE